MLLSIIRHLSFRAVYSDPTATSPIVISQSYLFSSSYSSSILLGPYLLSLALPIDSPEPICYLALCVRIQRLSPIIPHFLDNSQPFRSALTEQYPVSNGEIFRALYELEGYGGAVSSTNVVTVDVNDGAGLGDRAYV